MIRTLAILLLALAAPAAAQDAPGGRMAVPACATVSDTALPADLAAWRTRSLVTAAADAGGAPAASLTVGAGADARLRRNGEVSFPVLPSKPGGTVSYGGLLRFRVAEAGDYQVSLGSGAWIEVVADGRAVVSTRHSPGPACTTLKKTVVFPLTPGPYTLEVSGNGAEVLPVMVSRVR